MFWYAARTLTTGACVGAAVGAGVAAVGGAAVELAEQFRVSRITVRDALRVLEARGLIRVKVGASGGAFVTDTNLDQVVGSISTMVKLRRMTLSELAEARTIVETAAAERAASRA